ncbi:protoporphyrinogen oxidase [Halorussus gelatinilyticus]|uniref:Protoporphyrinogen oxidase n=1 Tax=Halorussus gelatinilyticus TaxID=2937524 RepID=A0A8U0IN21_9EURY|nr:protoporphyrinogen oxidase [Halorussus gelatinilyticus]UPW01419.1 protoporphyrinogen oxidase [Halorussus gelatinilyticus]
MSVGIVGGGITGLATHHYLRESGVESVVFEADDEPGGVVRSAEVEGKVLDFGPQRTRLTPAIRELVESLGLESELRRAADPPLYVYRDGRLRLVPQSPREAVTTDLLSWRGKFRALLEPLTGPARDGESVEAFLTRKFGPEVARYYFGPLYGGLYGSHPDEMPVEYSLSKALEKAGVERSVLTAVARKVLDGREAPPIVSFDAGLQRLPEALAAAHDEGVRLGTPVREIRREGDGFALETDDGATAVDRLVVTTPADVTADLLGDLAPDSAAALRELHYNPQAVVHLHAETDLTGAGYQVQYDEEFRTLGATWNDSLLDRDGVYTCYLGGSRNPELVERSDEALGSLAAAEFEEITGYEARDLSVHRLRRGMPAYDRSWAALDRISMPEGIRLCTNYTARAGLPGRVREAKQTAEALAESEESSSGEAEQSAVVA